MSTLTVVEDPMSTRALDKAYQCLFDVCVDIITLYKKCSSLDVGGGVPDMNPTTVEKEIIKYKEKYDTTSPDIHVDVACELYDSVKSSVNRGYLFNSWLRDEKSCLYYGASYDECDDCVLRLDKIFAMLEYMKRSSDSYSDQSAIMRHRFFCNLYTVFLETQRMKKLSTPYVVETLELKVKEILDDIPKLPRRSQQAPGGEGLLAGLLGGGGLPGIMDKLKTALPEIVKTATDAMESNGSHMNPDEKGMIDGLINNLTSSLGDAGGMEKLVADIGSGNADFSSIIQKLLPSMTSAMSGAGRAAPGSAPPAIDGPPKSQP